MEIVLNEAQIFIGDIPGQPGNKILRFITPMGISIVIPMDEKTAKSVASQLTTGLVVANGSLNTVIRN